ncbi:MAG: hypothetical protein ACI4WH_05330 [Oscillospiraceae bacterium]
MSASEIFDIPEYYYFKAGNDYLGSLHGLNFKITSGENLVVYIYYGVKSFELSEISQEKTFSQTENGYKDLISWLEGVYLEHKKTPLFKTRMSLK